MKAVLPVVRMINEVMNVVGVRKARVIAGRVLFKKTFFKFKFFFFPSCTNGFTENVYVLYQALCPLEIKALF